MGSFIKRNFSFAVFAALLAFSFLTGGCNNGEKVPDVSGIKINMQVKRLDRDLAKLDTNHLAAGLQQLKQAYPDFLDFYLDTLIGLNINRNYNDTVAAIHTGLKTYLTYKDYKGLLDTVATHYPDTKSIDEQLAKGFQYMKYYYPTFKVPQVVYLVSYLNNWGAFTYGDNFVGIGLDMFLGARYPYYRSIGLPDYLYTHLTADYIPVATFSAIYNNIHPFVTDERTLLDMIIQRGKQQYFLHKVLPFVADTTRYGYTQKQLKWCTESEAEVYNFFIRDNLFYQTNWQQVLRYVNDGPTSTGMPPQSPGNIGSWLGYRIVQSYVAQHPQITLNELLKENDAQKFLQEAKYKPNK
ncbi:MAG: hypothetical protein H0X33_14700 [Taibaiella sp.]|nr:hypothetical protein [Taibaiella sp.]